MAKDARAVALQKALKKLPVPKNKLGRPRKSGIADFALKLKGPSGGPISPQAVYAWKICPPEHVVTLEEESGVSRHELRPDIFGPKPK